MKIELKACTFALALLAGSAPAVPTPAPLANDREAAADWAVRLEPGEMSFRADIRFASAGSEASATRLFPLTLDASGHVRVTLPHAALSLIGDLQIVSRETVAKGDFHQYALVVSMMRHRVAFYIDGRLQFENDNTNLPDIAWGRPAVNPDFDGDVRDFRVWDVELESERLVRSPDSPVEPSDEPYTACPGFARNAAGFHSVWDDRAAENAEALRTRVEDACAATPRPARTEAFVAYTTDPMSDEPVMPDAIPSEADFSGEVNVFAAQGEYESASVVVMALRPIGEFTVRISDLTCGDARIPAADVDIRLVKRWYRTGGAWHTYFCDFRHRVLVPHLLVHDDDLIRVDEARARNYFRLNYPEGPRYVDVSDPRKGHETFSNQVPFEDAKTLQSVRGLDAFGRNQQYWLTFRGPKQPGLYTGTLELVANGRKAAEMRVNFRVLPFALPLRAGSYDDPSRPFVNHLNLQSPLVEGRTAEERQASARALLESCVSHNTFEISGVWGASEEIKAIARAAKLPSDIIFDGSLSPGAWQPRGKNAMELTSADRTLAMRRGERNLRAKYEVYAKEFPDSEKWTITFSEAGAWAALNVQQQDMARTIHAHGWNVFTHGGNNNWLFAGDIEDANFGACSRQESDRWHAVGGRVASYATPMFAAPESPAMQRRYLGLERWKEHRFDGNMQHGLKDHDQGINEFAPDPTGDGNYRCQIMMYRTQSGFLETICWDGVREAYDDVRYCSALQQLARAHRDASAEPLRREARRALMWLELVNGLNTTPRMVRSSCAERLVTLHALVAKFGKDGK